MRIFVAFGYNERDAWIRELVIPLIEAMGDEPVTGENLQGEIISEAIRKMIPKCAGVIAFATRRNQLDSGKWDTHRWVTDELSSAITRKQRVIEVRESDVDPQGGIAGDRQLLHYNEINRDRCLIELAKVLARWRRNTRIRLQLMPEECAQEIFPLLSKPELRCVYRLYVEGEISEDQECRIIPIGKGLYVEAKEVPPEAFIQLEVAYQDRKWISSFEGTDALRISLTKG